MTTHLSGRLTWHDTGWDGRVCKDPIANVYCTIHEHIRDQKSDPDEAANAGRLLSSTTFRPPCSRDPGAYSSAGYVIQHRDPLTWRDLGSVSEELPAYSFSTSAYGHMFSESGGWTYDRDTQLERIDEFIRELKPERSLIFFYLKDGQPFLETSQRIVCGVGRIAKIGKQLYFPGEYKGVKGYPVWARAITQDYPKQGFRLPLQEYWKAQRPVTAGLCIVPPNAQGSFSYVAEHVSDDVAVSILERLIDVTRWFQKDEFVTAAWDARIGWLESALAEVWRDRGPWPGVPAVLAYLGCPTGTTLVRELLQRIPPAEVWSAVEGMLGGALDSVPPGHISSIAKAQPQWKALPPSRREVLRTLAQMDLTVEQVTRISHPDERAAASINRSDEELVANPYLIAELDTGTDESDPVTFDAIDHAMMPSASVAAIEPIARHDDRRLRAGVHSVLNEAARDGDTVLRLSEVTARLDRLMTHERACAIDRDILIARRVFYEEALWIDESKPSLMLASREVNEDERLLQARFTKMVGKQVATKDVDWRAVLANVLRDEASLPSEDEERARREKIDALSRAMALRFSVITGRAGTGKTTVIRALLDGLETVEGRFSTLLLAPTGKARIRLQQATRRPAQTIHEFLATNGWIRFGNAFALRREGGNVSAADTVIIDESSMIPTDLLAALFRAIDWNQVRRFVVMGDANQLPPIGPGRPFSDLIDWLDGDDARTKHLIRLEHRGRFKDAHSLALQLSDGYVNGEVPPGDDEILAQIARNDIPADADIEVHFWDDATQLRDQLAARISALALGGADSYSALDASFIRDGQPAPEEWQILSPVRRQPFGTDEINRAIQLKYRRALIERANRRAFIGKFQLARPAGDQQIVWHDKVIQVVNEHRYSWQPGDEKGGQKRYVANGEVGIVTTAMYSGGRDKIQVTFGTQRQVRFSYYRSQVNETLELAYAVTVHKSQGSDFETVFLIMPQQAGTLSRELLYTALTRFRKKLVLLLERDVKILQQYRRPSMSETLSRNSNLFALRMRPEDVTRPYPEKLIHRTGRDELVSSKSEVIVAQTLKELGLSYKYEEPLYAKDDPRDFRLPDFTVYYEGEVWYWEHLGMLSVPSYAERWKRKQVWYERQGFFDRVITSEDGADGSIDAKRIEETARARILDA